VSATPPGPTPDAEWAALGAKLKSVREYLNLSQQLVATNTGIPRSAISDIERGVRKVDSLELRKFARLYCYPVSYFLDEDTGQDETATALARAVTGLTDQDRQEVLRFAEFLRYSAAGNRTGPQQ
jgi:transcriptional regulator with XRE-family HTH domain